MKLTWFLADLSRNKAKQKRYRKDPEAVLKGSGLSPALKKALRAGNVEAVKKVVLQELRAFDIITQSPTPWPGNRVPIYQSVVPDHARTGTTLVVTVTLQTAKTQKDVASPDWRVQFAKNAQVGGELVGPMGKRIIGQTVDTMPPLEEPLAIYTSRFDLTGAAPGPYLLDTVVYTGHEPVHYTSPGPVFTITDG